MPPPPEAPPPRETTTAEELDRAARVDAQARDLWDALWLAVNWQCGDGPSAKLLDADGQAVTDAAAQVSAFPFARVLGDLDAPDAALPDDAGGFDAREDLGRLSNPKRAAWEFQALTEMCAAQPELADIFCKEASE